MARYVYINGVRYDESQVFTDDNAYESLDDYYADIEEIEAVKYELYRERNDEYDGQN